MKYDFGGYATKNNIKCADGRVIRPNAFVECDGAEVPLVYQHIHDDPLNVLGHAILENREDGVYAYCSFNESESGKHAKELVRHGDIKSLSIYANRLKQQGSDVLHGVIREVSMVMAGANPGAKIDNVSFAHSDGFEYESEDDVIIHFDVDIDHIVHADTEDDKEKESSNQNGSSDSNSSSELNDSSKSDQSNDSTDDETIKEIYDAMSDKKKALVNFLMAVAAGEIDEEEIDIDVQHADDEETVQDLWDSFTDKEKMVANYLVAKISEESEEDDDETENDKEMKHSYEGDDYMYNNIFNQNQKDDTFSLTHADVEQIIDNAKRGNGSFKDAMCGFIRNTFEVPNDATDEDILRHGIESLDVMFPEAKTASANPELIARPMDWVAEVFNATKKTPFSNVKSVAADITADEARARGYIKGKQKKEEVVKLLKRVTYPQTVYKLQKLDRDDVVDITEIDIIAWLKNEMRLMLQEEISRAVLIGDGRDLSDESKIKEDNIRPIYSDDDLYTIKKTVTITDGMDRLEKSDAIVDAAIEARKDYMGSGSPVMYASVETINMMLLARDKVGHRLYKTVTELADACRVSKIVEVPVLETATRTKEGKTYQLLALIVNLSDYTIGANKGGEVTFFDDFDLNFNKYEYLIETRFSGSLTKPYSAIALEMDAESTSVIAG